MDAIDQILIALDDDSSEDAALKTGFTLARQHGASVLILGVVKDMDSWTRALSDILPEEELRSRFMDHHRARIEKLAREHGNEDIDIEIEVSIGEPFVEIIRMALGKLSSLIIQASHPQNEGRLFFSSADWHLMRKSPVPVWIVKNNIQYQPRHIAVAIDLMSTDESNTVFNQQLLRFAATIARGAEAILSVVSAWHLYGEEMLVNSPFLKVSHEELEGMLKKTESGVLAEQKRMKNWLEEQAILDTDSVSWHLLKAKARQAIPMFIDDNDVDLVVMGTVGRTGIPGLLIGNTAETLLSSIRCSVVTLKPSLFMSPVE